MTNGVTKGVAREVSLPAELPARTGQVQVCQSFAEFAAQSGLLVTAPAELQRGAGGLEAACWWDLVHRGAAIPRRSRSCGGGIWLQESSENELGSSVRRWDLAWRRRQGWR